MLGKTFKYKITLNSNKNDKGKQGFKKTSQALKLFFFLRKGLFRVASGPGISGNWESQGILWCLKNAREKSVNFTKFGKVREF